MATEPNPAGDSVRSTSSWRWPAVIESVVIAVILIVLSAILIPVLQQAREAARRTECKSHLKAIGLALHQYHDKHGSFPPAYIVDADGKRLHSWRVLILPELGFDALYARYRFDEPWDGPHNTTLIKEMPPIFGCPSDSSRPVGTTNYSAIVGVETMWPMEFASTIRMITDGTSNTLMVVETDDLHVPWTEPRDPTVEEVRRGANRKTSPGFCSHHDRGAQACLADGAVKFLSERLDLGILRSLGNAASGGPMPIPGLKIPVNFGADQHAVAKSHHEMPKTIVHATLVAPIAQGKNIVTCATLPLASEELKTFLNVKAVELNPPSSLATELNQTRFPRSALSEESYLALGGRCDEVILARIRQTRAQKFPNAILPLPDPLATDEFIVYAYLFKWLPFHSNFDKLIHPLPFHTSEGVHQVQSFGIDQYELAAPHEESLRQQVDVLDYASDKDFIVRLKTQSDHIVLAKIAPDATLESTWQSVLRRSKTPLGGVPPAPVTVGEKLVVPLVGLYVYREYDELSPRHIIDTDYRLRVATQYIKFQLDESGARLESSVELIGDSGPGPAPLPPKPREFIFDHSFLLAMHQPGSDVPYLLMWVTNEELLVPTADDDGIRKR